MPAHPIPSPPTPTQQPLKRCPPACVPMATNTPCLAAQQSFYTFTGSGCGWLQVKQQQKPQEGHVRFLREPGFCLVVSSHRKCRVAACGAPAPGCTLRGTTPLHMSVCPGQVYALLDSHPSPPQVAGVAGQMWPRCPAASAQRVGLPDSRRSSP